jgi:hypothetical protein
MESWGKGKRRTMDFSGEEEIGMLRFKKSEYSTTALIRPVNIIDQDRGRRNETVTVNQSDNFQKTRRHPRRASIGFTACSFETLKAVNGGSHDPMDVDGKFLDEI